MASELDPPFVEPLWYRYRLEQKRCPGKVCFCHDICERIEHDLLLLTHPEGLPPELEDNFQIRKIKRIIKMTERFYKKNRRKSQYRRKRKTEKRKEAAEAAAAAAAAAAELEQMTRNEQDLDFLKPSPVWNIKVGKKIKVLRLLSRRGKRNYLIKIKGKEKETEEVTIDELKTKYVLLLFWFLSDNGIGLHESDPNFMADMYRAYNPTGEFEVVFVAFGTNEDAFRATFSRMPWLAIPHQDQQGRDLFQTEFAIPYSPLARAVLFDPNGRVLLDCPESEFSALGVECFPFTEERIEEVTSSEIREADALLDKIVLKKEEPPLTELLGYNIITSEGNQVSTSVLEGKTVGFYYLEISTKGYQRTRKVLEIWKSLKDVPDKDLEIVFVNEDGCNLSYAKAIYKDKFGSPMPWYSLLPSNRSKLSKVFRYIGRFGTHDHLNNMGYLIILMPDKYQSLSYFGFEILEKFGIEAYPFTLETAVKIVTSKQQKKLVLSKLLSPSALLLRGNSNGNKESTTVSELSENNVLLLFATHSCYGSGSFLPALKKSMYHEKKGTEDDFEIIYISLDCDESPSSFPKCIQEMPWLVHAHVPNFAVSLSVEVFKVDPFLPAIAAFGRDGHLVTKESNLAFKKDWNSKYPFIEVMEEEVCRGLIRKHKWDLKSLYFPESRPESKLYVL